MRRNGSQDDETQFTGELAGENSSSMIKKFNIAFDEATTSSMPGENLLESLNQFFLLYYHLPIARKLNDIVTAATAFLSETDPVFSDMRKKNIDNKTILARLNKNAGNLKKLLAEMKTAGKTPAEEALISTVTRLALTCLNDRITELKNSKDRIYHLYSSHDNQLRELLEKQHHQLSHPKSCN
jgi:hypothetical protein